MQKIKKFLGFAAMLAFAALATGSAISAPFAYAAEYSRLLAIDTQTQALVAEIPLTRCCGFRSIGTLPGSRYLYVTEEREIAVIDTVAQARVANIPVRAQLIAIAPHRARVYAAFSVDPFFQGLESPSTRISAISADSNAEVAAIEFPGGLDAMVFDAAGKRGYLSQYSRDQVLVVDTASNEIVSRISSPRPSLLAIDSVSNLLYVARTNFSSQSSVRVIDLNTAMTVADIPGGSFLHGMALNPAGSRLFVASMDDNTVSVIDTGTRKVVATIATDSPTHLEVTPSGEHLYVRSQGGGYLSIYSVDTLQLVRRIAVNAHISQTGRLIGGENPVRDESPGVLSGLYGNPGEPGWGLHLTHRRNSVFASWHTYDAAGVARWYVASNCTMSKPLACPTCVDNTICSGLLYEADGPRFFRDPFDSAGVHLREVGLVEIQFRDRDNAWFTHVVNRHGRSVQVRRQVFAQGTVAPSTDYTDLWFSPREAGWGLGLTHQFNKMFLAWFVYDDAGRPVWLFASDCRVSAAKDGCTGDVYRASGPIGPAAGVPYDPSRLKVVSVGSATLTFTDTRNGLLTWKVDGLSGAKSITRQLF